MAGAQAVMAGIGLADREDSRSHFPKLSWDTTYLVFTVHERFPSQTTTTQLVFGRVSDETPLVIESHMPERGVIFSDELDSDFLGFNSGARAEIQVAERQGMLVFDKYKNGTNQAPVVRNLMNTLDSHPATVTEFSTDTLILPCLMVSKVLNQKNCGWPSNPIQIEKDNDLKAQIIYDFGHALNGIWEKKAKNIRAELDAEWTSKIPQILKGEKLLDQLNLFETWQAAKLEVALRYKTWMATRDNGEAHVFCVDQCIDEELRLGLTPIPNRESDIRQTPEYTAVLVAEKALYKAERQEAVISSSYHNACEGRANRILKFQKKEFIYSKSKSHRATEAFSNITASEVRDNCIYASALGDQNLGWLGRVCENLSKLSNSAKWCLPSFNFRRKIDNLHRKIDADKQVDPRKPQETIFLNWILETGGSEGISPDDSYKSLSMACLRQDKELDEQFKNLGFQSFLDFRKRGKSHTHEKIIQLVNVRGV